MERRDFLLQAAAAVGGTRALAARVPLRLLEPASSSFEEVDVFVSGDGYPTYRIPSVLSTRRGTVLAFAEGRQGRGDHSENDLVLRRSTDGGRSWGPLQLVASDRPHVLVNPTLLEVSRSGRLWLMYQRFPHGFHQREVVPGYDGDRICRSYVRHSDDDGRSWSEPECQATIIRYSHPAGGQRSRILFANPASPTQRVNGTVRLSYDEGRTWPVSRTVYPGSFAYSCLTVLEDGGIGLLYERDDYGRITFARFDVGWLTDGRDVGHR